MTFNHHVAPYRPPARPSEHARWAEDRKPWEPGSWTVAAVAVAVVFGVVAGLVGGG